jgi:hypothetical protein
VDLTPLAHIRTLGSLEKRFSNGLRSKEEELLIRQRLMSAMNFEVNQTLKERLEEAVA